MESIQDAMSENLKRLRKIKGFTQEALAEKAGMSWNGYQGIEAGRRWPDLSSLEKIAEALNVPVAALFQTKDQIVIEPTPQQALEVLQNVVALHEKRAKRSGGISPADQYPYLLDTISSLQNLELITDILDVQAPGWREGRPQEVGLNPNKVRSKTNK